MVTQIGTFAQQQSLVDYMLNAQRQFDTTSIQLSTGKTSQNFAGIAYKSATVFNIAEAQVASNQYLDAVKISDNRADLTTTALTGVNKIVTDFYNYISSSQNQPPNNPGDPVKWAADLNNWMQTTATQAQAYLNQVADLLNESDGSQFLFAGSNPNQAPVTILQPGSGSAVNPPIASQLTFGSVAADASTSSAGYRFQINATGSNTSTQVKVNTSTYVQPQVTLNTNTSRTPATLATQFPYNSGGNPAVNALQQALSGIVQVADLSITGLFPTPTSANVQTVYNTINNPAGLGAWNAAGTGTGILAEAKQALLYAQNGASSTPITDAAGTTISTSTGILNIKSLITQVTLTKTVTANAKSINQSYLAYSTNTAASIVNIDYAATAAKLQADQLALNSSYSALSKVSQVSLLNYLS